MKDRPIAIDLFAGCGGLTLGLKHAGFDVRVAVELDNAAAATYQANHSTTILKKQDICKVMGAEILTKCKKDTVSLLAGCAPCQGFCSLTNKSEREDPRNGLLLEMLRIIGEVQPKAVFMENVPGLAKRGEAVFLQFLEGLRKLEYEADWRILQMADYGVPQSRRRLVLLAGHGFRIPFPEPTHAKPGSASHLPVWKNFSDALGEMPTPVTLRASFEGGGPRRFNWHVVRDLQPQTKVRLDMATPGKTWLAVDEAVRPKCHQGGYKGFTNVYGRMSWDQTPVTITGGCTTACKGRFGHPDMERTTISVREAALIQTFPKNYRFETDRIDTVCEMIGNAVPPFFAARIAKQILRALKDYESLARKR